METIDTPAIVAPINTPGVVPKKEEEPKLPPMYAVILHNDPTTTPTFVTDVLVQVFGISRAIARQIMMTAHEHGECLVKIYSKEVAETKVEQAMTMSRSGRGNGLNPDLPCELTFTAQPERDGDK